MQTLKRGLKDAVGVIEALDSMTPRSREFESEVLKFLRDLLKLKLSTVPGLPHHPPRSPRVPCPRIAEKFLGSGKRRETSPSKSTDSSATGGRAHGP